LNTARLFKPAAQKQHINSTFIQSRQHLQQHLRQDAYNDNTPSAETQEKAKQLFRLFGAKFAEDMGGQNNRLPNLGLA
jgi:hypothetical protein